MILTHPDQSLRSCQCHIYPMILSSSHKPKPLRAAPLSQEAASLRTNALIPRHVNMHHKSLVSVPICQRLLKTLCSQPISFSYRYLNTRHKRKSARSLLLLRQQSRSEAEPCAQKQQKRSALVLGSCNPQSQPLIAFNIHCLSRRHSIAQLQRSVAQLQASAEHLHQLKVLLALALRLAWYFLYGQLATWIWSLTFIWTRF